MLFDNDLRDETFKKWTLILESDKKIISYEIDDQLATEECEDQSHEDTE